MSQDFRNAFPWHELLVSTQNEPDKTGIKLGKPFVGSKRKKFSKSVCRKDKYGK